MRRRLRQGPDAAAALGPKAVPALARLLADARYRDAAARALVKLGGAARPVLLRELEAERLPVRRLLDVLGRLRPKADPGPFFPYLNDPDPRLRRTAALAVSRQGGPRAHKALAAAMVDPDDKVRDLSVHHFTHTTDPRAIRPLALAVAYGDEFVSRFASARIAALGALAVAPLIDALRTNDEPLRATIGYLLDALNDGDSLVILCKGLEEDDPRIWQTVRDALMRKPPHVAMHLVPLGKHPEPRVREVAGQILAHFARPSTEPVEEHFLAPAEPATALDTTVAAGSV